MSEYDMAALKAGARRSSTFNSKEAPDAYRYQRPEFEKGTDNVFNWGHYVNGLYLWVVFGSIAIAYIRNPAVALAIVSNVGIKALFPLATSFGYLSKDAVFRYGVPLIFLAYWLLITMTGGFRSPFIVAFTHATNMAGFLGPMSTISMRPMITLVATLFSFSALFEFPIQNHALAAEILTSYFLYQGFSRAVYFKDLYEKALQVEKQANADRAAFVANVSHEIRTPLTSIMGWTDVLLGTSSISDDFKEKLEIIKNSGSALLTILRDILDYSKIEKGRLDFETVDFNIEKVVKACLDSNKVLARPSVKVVVDVDLSSAPFVIGDPHRLAQCVSNIFQNAAKFTMNGSITFSARVKEITKTPMDFGGKGTLDSLFDETVVYEFKVIDTGIGMGPATVKKLFQPFKQADSSTTRRFGGTGLGLAITKTLVHSMLGEIIVTSEEGVGTEFSWTISLKRSRKTDYDSEIKEKPLVKENLRPLKVLLTDDNEFNQRIISKILSTLSCEVDIANNGLEATEIFKAKPFDLVLMDIQMPVMDGIDATKIINEDKAARHLSTPVIALTANADSKSREDCIAVGMEDVLPKPIKVDTLRELLNKRRKEIEEAEPAA